MKTLGELTARKRCAMYNELSHMTPYYLTPELRRPLDLETELLFHKRNVYLLALTFDHIIICTDNIAAFTRFVSADISSKVIGSEWFRKLVDAGIIVLCGWGSDHGPDLMENQIDYSLRYRPELKSPSLLNQLRVLGRNSEIVLREPSYGERDHVLFLRDKIRYLEGQFMLDEVSFLTDLIEETQAKHGFVGTMEIFPVIDDAFLSDTDKADAFYRAYFQSWQEYSTVYYSPAITVDSLRIRLPGRKTRLKRLVRDAEVISSLYSPDFFAGFLNSRLGAKVAIRLLDIRPERLIAIRNGDWRVFVERYHECLESASEIAWIIAQACSLNLLSNEKEVTDMVDYIFNVLDPKTDFASIGSLLDAVLRTVIGFSFLGPLFNLFKTHINRRLLATVNKTFYKELEPFLRKLNSSLLPRAARTSLITP